LEDRTKVIKLPIDEFPSLLILPYYNTPFALRDGEHAENKDNLFGVWRHVIRYDERKIKELGSERAVLAHLNVDYFARMLAKIGHAFATGALGLGVFKPLLLATIFDEATDPHYLVGGSPNAQPCIPNVLHQTTLRILEYPERGLVVADIQLFSVWGAPLYHVIVGETPPLALRELTGD
jgi:hypothetical protein